MKKTTKTKQILQRKIIGHASLLHLLNYVHFWFDKKVFLLHVLNLTALPSVVAFYFVVCYLYCANFFFCWPCISLLRYIFQPKQE